MTGPDIVDATALVAGRLHRWCLAAGHHVEPSPTPAHIAEAEEIVELIRRALTPGIVEKIMAGLNHERHTAWLATQDPSHAMWITPVDTIKHMIGWQFGIQHP